MGTLEGINPEFARRWNAMVAAGRQAGYNLSITDGNRTVSQQIALRRKNGCPDIWSSPASSCRVPTAIPGKSNHQHGLAIDMGPEGRDWANANAARFGLHFPVEGENWHVEMIGDEAARAAGNDAQVQGAIGFNMQWMQEPGDPEEEIRARLDTIMKMAMPSQDLDIDEPMDVISPSLGGEPITPLNAMGGQNPMESEGTKSALEPLGLPTDVTGPEVVPPVRMEQQMAGGQAGGSMGPGGIPSPGYVPPGEGVERWRGVASAALRYTGQSQEYLDLLLRRMAIESGGDNTIVNNWDDNARRGDPTQGLMQNIPSAFPERAKELAGRGINDGFANIVASIRYTIGRYGTLAAWGKKGGY